MTSSDLPPALSPSPPWLLLGADPGPVQRWRHDVTRAGGRVVVLPGRRMRTEEGLHVTTAAALSFPDYYGHNPSALEDCLTDLSWLEPAPALLLVIEDAEEVLAAEVPLVAGIYAALLERVCATWAEPVATGEWWDRGAVPAHVLLLASTDCTAATMRRRWAAADAEIADL